MPPPKNRPPFNLSSADVPETTHRYPKSEEPMGPARAIGRAAGLLKIGLHVQRIPPGHRISWPHAESREEEFVYVLDGEVDAWIDGELHRMNVASSSASMRSTSDRTELSRDGSWRGLTASSDPEEPVRGVISRP